MKDYMSIFSHKNIIKYWQESHLTSAQNALCTYLLRSPITEN